MRPLPVRTALVTLALASAPLCAQTTIYTANFGAGEVNPTTYDAGLDWTIASTKNPSPSPSISGSGLTFGIASTSSGISQAQGRVLSSPVSLASAGDTLTLQVTFTDGSNLLAAGNSSINVGLFNTGGVDPLTGLTSSGLSGSLTTSATGGAQNWTGYVTRFLASGSPTIFTRDPQIGTTNANQDLLFSAVGGGTYANPAGTTVASASSTTIALTASNSYTVSYSIALNGSGGYDFSSILYDGVGTGGSVLASVAGTAATPLTGSFDGVAVGFRDADTATSTANLITITGISLSLVSVPEPSTYAVLAGLLGLGFAIRRRRQA